jgi:selenocysteine-specific elongation factor
VTEQIRRVVGTAGHIDHGKTSLVRALTGIDCDRLPEEKKRGITIDLGFASWRTADLQIGFVDVPGHERFVKNMLAGIGGIDSVLLVVAADESIKPQTREHFAICKLLGIREGVVALTKSDLTDPEIIELVRLEVGEMVEGSFLQGKPIIPVSSTTGQGIDALREALVESVRRSDDPLTRGSILRLPIDRSFTVKGFGTVVTGTLLSGRLGKDDELELLPEGRPTRARNIEVHGESRDEAVAGERTSVNVSDLSLGDLRRGQQLTRPGTLRPTQILTVDLELLPSASELKDQTRVRVHHFAEELLGTVKLLDDRNRLAPGEGCVAQLRLESPVAAAAGDRFIIRRYSPALTIGGGRVLDPHLPKLSGRKREEMFETLRHGSPVERATLLARLGGLHGVSLQSLAQRWGKRADEIGGDLTKGRMERLVAVTSQGPWLHADEIQQFRRKAMTWLKDFFARERMSVGVARGEFAQKLFPRDLDPAIADFLIRDLVSERILEVRNDLFDVPGRSREIGGAEGELARTIERRFRESGLKVPAVSEIIREIPQKPKVIEGVIAFLVKSGTLIRLADGIYVHRDAVDEAKGRIAAHRGEKIDVAWFKTFFDLSRKVAIPLLEHFDSKGVTRRVGDQRQVL